MDYKVAAEEIVDEILRVNNSRGYSEVYWHGLTGEENNLLCYLAEKLNVDLDFHEHSPICGLTSRER